MKIQIRINEEYIINLDKNNYYCNFYKGFKSLFSDSILGGYINKVSYIIESIIYINGHRIISS